MTIRRKTVRLIDGRKKRKPANALPAFSVMAFGRRAVRVKPFRNVAKAVRGGTGTTLRIAFDSVAKRRSNGWWRAGASLDPTTEPQCGPEMLARR